MILGAYTFYRVSQKEALESQYSDLVNRLDVGIVRLKESGEIIHMNQAMSSLLGFAPEKIAKKLSIINFFVDATEWQNILDFLKKNTSITEYDFWLGKKGGTRFIASFSLNARKRKSGEILYIDGVIQDITDKRQAEAKLQETNHRLEILSTTDGLTGLANRRFFDESLLKEYSRHSRSGKNLALILLDIDCFKAYNDSYGHIAGDKCLQKISKILADFTHRPSDLAARYGGEEFVCILPETDLDGAIAVAEKIRCGIMDLTIPHKSSRVEDLVTASLGVVSVRCSNDGSPQDIIEQADALLYQAKESGRNRVEVAL
ncbi:MAG: diguanylate cyclase [Proteobacteria bacterium]|nr:diguanylate cyclase [Pseudomonadota bacterium]MBU1687872.1 diguanylate cyclase [Pseudomonadota bacterium]